MSGFIEFTYIKLRTVQSMQMSGKYPARHYEKIETFIEEDTRIIVHRTVMPYSPSKSAPWDLTQFS